MANKRKPLGAAAGSKRKTDLALVGKVVDRVKEEAGEKPFSSPLPAQTDPAGASKPSSQPSVPVIKLTAKVAKDLFYRMKVHCAKKEITIKEFLERAIEDHLP